MTYFLVIAVTAIVVASKCSAQFCSVATGSQCPVQQRSGCCVWTPVNPTDQTVFTDSTLNFTMDTNCRPLGFAFATYYFPKSPSIAQPCAVVSHTFDKNNQSDAWAIVHIQTKSQLCAVFTVNGIDAPSAACQDSSFRICQRIPGQFGDTIAVRFYCDNCGESSVSFWYRIITYSPGGVDGNDLCGLQPNMFPDDLIQLPADRDQRNINPTIPVATTSTATQACHLGWSLLALAASVYLLQ